MSSDLRLRGVIVAAAGLAVGIVQAGPAAGLEDAGGSSRGRAARVFDDSAVHLCGGAVRTDGPWLPLAAALLEPGAKLERRIIQLDGPMTEERRAILERAGVRLTGYLPVNAYYADFSGANLARVGAISFVKWQSALDPAWKIDPMLGQMPVASPEGLELLAAGKVAAVVSLFEGASAEEVEAFAAGEPGVSIVGVSEAGGSLLVWVTMPADAAQGLALLDTVQYIEQAPEAQPRNNTTRWIVQSNVQNLTPLYDQGLRGEGQVIGVLDGMPDVNHCSFSDPGVQIGALHRKVLAYNAPAGTDFHGTHVLGIVVGDGGAFDERRGVAFKAKAVVGRSPAPVVAGEIATKLAQHRLQGARIHTNSWGADFRSDYMVWSREIDAFTRDNEDDLVLVAVSNTSLVYVPENAKNCLAVAATENAPLQTQHAFGGAGPTADGRRKPEIMAPGRDIPSSSAQSACLTLVQGGTSMAAPAVAGTAALIRQYFVEGMYPSGVRTPGNELTPSGALLRAAVVNSGEDMTGEAFLLGYPSAREGWGRVLADNVLHFPGDARTLLVWDVRNTSPSAIATGGERVHNFEVTDGGEQLRVTMAFTDAPAELNAAYAPVNNISLEATSPTGLVYRGNAFGTFESIAGGRAEPSSDFDPRNTLEQVHVTAPETGVWTVRIIGESVNVGTQGYALVVTGAVGAGPACPADLTGDGLINAADLTQLLGAWGAANGSAADITGDGLVNSVDLTQLLGAWGACP